uniref:Uncharacterized protein n=1 Tax=Strigamia maritima TaxID=126957 RepID=T1IKG0_STRMM
MMTTMGFNLLIFMLLTRYITSISCMHISDALLKTLDAEIDAQCLLEEKIDLRREVKSLELCTRNTKLSMDKDKLKGRDKIQVFRINICRQVVINRIKIPRV